MRILQNVNLQVMKGEMVAIMGPSGSGKTTLLHVLTGVDTPDDGEIVIGGETFSQLTEEEKAFFRRKHMGMISGFPAFGEFDGKRKYIVTTHS